MAWTGESTFFLLAAFVQAGVGLAILVRRPRIEWAVVLAVLFLGNAAIAVNSLLVSIDYPNWGGWVSRRVFYVFDRLTTLLIAYLALAYPRRPRWAQARWVLPSLFGALVATVILTGLFHETFGVVHHVAVPPGQAPAGCVDPCSHPTPWYYWSYHATNFGFLLILVRWARLLPQVTSPIELGQFRLLFAAFAVRAVHIELLIYRTGPLPLLFRVDPMAGLDPLYWVPYARGGLAVLAIAFGAVTLLRARRGLPSDRRKAVDFVLAFFLIGGVEMVLASRQALGFGLGSAIPVYYFGVLLHLDVLVLRPALVVYAMVRYDLLGSWARRRSVLLALVGALASIGYASGLYDALLEATRSVPVTLLLAVPLGLALGFATALVLNAYAGPDGNTRAQRFVTLLEDAYRNGPATPQALQELERKRQRLGLDPGEATALHAAVAGRWKGDGLWLPGQRVGRYELRKLLGSGGWGETYLADDLVDGREVVLKRTKALNPIERKALLAEAYVLTKLSHPNIVPLLRTEVIADEPVLVLECMPGGSLAARLAASKARGLPAPDVHAVADGILAALTAVHAAGIVHGDVKPGNILFDGDGRARLGDFGLAHSVPAPARLGDPTPSVRATGTVRYLAPEQARGQPARPASDVYAAGVVLLEALTGRHPVPTSVPEYEQRRRIAEDPVAVPASTGAWRPLLRGMLDVDPRRRPSAAAARQRIARLR